MRQHTRGHAASRGNAAACAARVRAADPEGGARVLPQVGSLQPHRPVKGGKIEARREEGGASNRRPTEAGAVEGGEGEVGAVKLSVVKVGAGGVAAREARGAEVGAAEVGAWPYGRCRTRLGCAPRLERESVRGLDCRFMLRLSLCVRVSARRAKRAPRSDARGAASAWRVALARLAPACGLRS